MCLFIFFIFGEGDKQMRNEKVERESDRFRRGKGGKKTEEKNWTKNVFG